MEAEAKRDSVIFKGRPGALEASLDLAPSPEDGHRGAEYAKRVFDLGFATLALALLSPVWALIAIAIRLDSPGPIIFRARRIGRGARPFRLFKFRTMVNGAHQRQDEVRHLNGAGEGTFKAKSDPRVTRVGAFLRSTSLDELPQLLNVIAGQMSLVGPRPLTDWEEAYLRARGERLSRRPGMTGTWQISGRWDASLEERAVLDEQYHRDRSLLGDIGILAKTAAHVVGRRGV